ILQLGRHGHRLESHCMAMWCICSRGHNPVPPPLLMPSSDLPHSRAALAERFGPSYRWRVLATVMIGTVASIMASTIVNVAIPDMSRVFSLGQERAPWLSAYLHRRGDAADGRRHLRRPEPLVRSRLDDARRRRACRRRAAADSGDH